MNRHHDMNTKPGKGSILKRVLLVMTGVIVGCLGLGSYYIYSNLQPVDSSSKEEILVKIPIGSSPMDIAKVLEEKEIIKDANMFYYYFRYKKEDKLRAGEYVLTQSMTPDELIARLKEGKVYADSTKITIPEGLSVDEIINLLVKKGVADKDKLIQAINHGNFDDIPFVKNIPASSDRKYRFEGFLFPKTYEFRKTATEEKIVRTMLEQTQRELKPEWLEEIKKSKKNLYEVFTLASIIEREAVVPEERKRIAGVYYNRIAQGMKLQADATIQFALGKQKERLLYKDLELQSKYNTYLYKGLPPSPIAVPGSSSLEAAIFPEKNQYLFYVAKMDGSQSHYFAKTYEEHQNYINQAKKNSTKKTS